MLGLFARTCSSGDRRFLRLRSTGGWAHRRLLVCRRARAARAWRGAVGVGAFAPQPGDLAIASSANIGGALTILRLPVGCGAMDLLLPGILVGSLGNAIGTYAGFLMVWWLQSTPSPMSDAHAIPPPRDPGRRALRQTDLRQRPTRLHRQSRDCSDSRLSHVDGRYPGQRVRRRFTKGCRQLVANRPRCRIPPCRGDSVALAGVTTGSVLRIVTRAVVGLGLEIGAARVLLLVGITCRGPATLQGECGTKTQDGEMA